MIELTILNQTDKPKETGYLLDISKSNKLENALSILRASRELLIAVYFSVKAKLAIIHNTAEKRAFVKHLVYMRKGFKKMQNVEIDLILRIQSEHQKANGLRGFIFDK